MMLFKAILLLFIILSLMLCHHGASVLPNSGPGHSKNVSELLSTRQVIISSQLLGPRTCSHMFSAGSAIKFMTSQPSLPDAIRLHLKGDAILFHSPCLSEQSIGNSLSELFEVFLCAQVSGAHFMDISPSRLSNGIYNRLPIVSANPRLRPVNEAIEIAKTHCKCQGICHENPSSLIHSNIKILKNLMQNAINSFWDELSKSDKMVKSANIYLEHRVRKFQDISQFPSIPDVAIHYRCSDNLVTHYGFLPFHVLKSKIPSSSSSIYILAESKFRHTHGTTFNSMCDSIFNSLFQYLKEHFPRSLIIIFRGDNPFIDMARLALAKTTICSVSTFCFWPAIASTNLVYFPSTKLIAKGNRSASVYGENFHWIEDQIIKGIDIRRSGIDHILKLLFVEK